MVGRPGSSPFWGWLLVHQVRDRRPRRFDTLGAACFSLRCTGEQAHDRPESGFLRLVTREQKPITSPAQPISYWRRYAPIWRAQNPPESAQPKSNLAANQAALDWLHRHNCIQNGDGLVKSGLGFWILRSGIVGRKAGKKRSRYP
jgi:hypothetical protein